MFLLTMVSGQTKPLVNAGISFPVFFKSSLYADGALTPRTEISGYNLSVEIPFPVAKKRIKLFLNPGLIYTAYSESMESATSAMGGHIEGSYKHRSVGIYTKLLIDIEAISPGNTIFYSGINTGYHVYSTTKGYESGRVGITPAYYWRTETDTNGQWFYNSFSAGVLIGLKPDYERNLLLTPALEITFFPYYANLLDYYSDLREIEENNSMLSVTLILGINPIK